MVWVIAVAQSGQRIPCGSYDDMAALCRRLNCLAYEDWWFEVRTARPDYYGEHLRGER